jgi:8-oxo-dGTP diphosphatase
MAREPILAAGGIVVKRGAAPLIAVVRQRKRNEWVLPKGKLTVGETARAAAEREVLEETGHDVLVHEFLGTLVYEASGRTKIVNFWRMEAHPAPSRPLMNDVKAVVWLSLDQAVERLSRAYEREFLAHIGPAALLAHGIGATLEPASDIADAPALAPEFAADDDRKQSQTPLRKAWLWLASRLGRD